MLLSQEQHSQNRLFQLREHPGCVTVSSQAQQYPTGGVELDTQSTVAFFGVIYPQVACV